MIRYTHIFTFALALLIAVTSQHMAAARGIAKSADGSVVLCTGVGPVSVMLDDQGNPIGPVHICPDCALNWIAALATPDESEPEFIHMSFIAQGSEIVWLLQLSHTNTTARGPPVFA